MELCLVDDGSHEPAMDGIECPVCGTHVAEEGVSECPKCGSALADSGASLLSSAYSLRKPRDLLAGTMSGVKNAGKGVLLGAATLIAAPIIGAKEEGVKGFAKGLVAGVLGAVSLSVAGVVSGSVQVVRGVINTPRSIIARSRSMVWDDATRTWKHVEPYFLQKEVEEVQSTPAPTFVKSKTAGAAGGDDAGGGEAAAGKRKVANTEFYDLLGVAPSATASEIKKVNILFFHLGKF